MDKAFRVFLAIVTVAISLGWNTPTLAAEMSPETRKLFDAVRANNFGAVKRNLLDGANVEQVNISGRTAIDLAIDKGYFPIAHYLLAWRKQRTDTKARQALPPEAPDTPPDTIIAAPIIAPVVAPIVAPIVAPEPVAEAAPVYKQEWRPVVEKSPQPVIPAAPPVAPAPIVAEAKPEPVPVKEISSEKLQEATKTEGLSRTKEPKKTTGVFDKITSFFSPTRDKTEDQPEKQQPAAPVAPETKKAEPVIVAEPTPPAKPPAKHLAKPKKPEIAAIPPAKVARVTRMADSPFINIKISLGRNQPKIPVNPCIEKSAAKSLFCIEPVKWPSGGASQDIGALFEVYTTLYRGQKTIVQYENGRAKQFHSLFSVKNYGAVIDYFTKRFGAPSQTLKFRAVLIGRKNRKNRTTRWLGPKQTDGTSVVLEVREFDNLRWSAPTDHRYGAVWLHYQGDDPVFRYISWSDFLLARVRR
ncbi:MAG: hypothetical protein V3R37_08170 [Rhodospirillales bacterium]